MNKLNLASVTLVCADCFNVERAIRVIEKCKSLCDFADIKLFTSLPTAYAHKVAIQHFDGLNGYSAFMLKDLAGHIHTSHVQVVQHDGWIIDTSQWDPKWLLCDYLGPLFIQHQTLMSSSVGSGGFSLRSKALLDRVAELLPPKDGQHSYDGTPGNNWSHEDGVISCHLREQLVQSGLCFGTPDQAMRYAYGGNPWLFVAQTFGFHGFWPYLSKHFDP